MFSELFMNYEKCRVDGEHLVFTNAYLKNAKFGYQAGVGFDEVWIGLKDGIVDLTEDGIMWHHNAGRIQLSF